MNKVRLIKILFLFLTLLSARSVCSQSTFRGNTIIDDVVAVVGKNMIKSSEVETSYLQGLSENNNLTRCEVLETLLINKLMLHQAQVDSVEISDVEVENELEARINYMLQVYGSQDRLEKMMGKTLTDIKISFRDMIRDNLMIQQTQSKIVGDVTITPAEVSDYFKSIPDDSLTQIPEQYMLTQIVILPKLTDEEKNEVKDRLNSLRERILKGTKFSTMAQLYSDDPASAKNGGELGFFSRGQMVAEFENMAFSLQPGEVSPVFETKFGYHIIQMIERRGDRVNCRHILLQPKISSMQLYNAKLKLDTIKSMIEKGEITFEDAIVKYSEDDSKINGGVIINPNNASSSFGVDALNATIGNVDNVDFASMNEGDVSNPVEFKSESSSAYRLIKVKKKTDAHKINISDDFDKIQTLALAKKRSDIINNWAKNTIKRTYIKIDDRFKSCGFNLEWIKAR